MAGITGIKKWLWPNEIHVKAYGSEFTLHLSRFRKNYEEAQRWLTQQVAQDCNRFIPFRNGKLRQSLTFPRGLDGGVIEWNTPYAHYQYEGQVYENTYHHASGFIGSDGAWHGWRGKKVPTMRSLTYHTPGTGDHWFDKAKEAYGQDWVKGTKKIAGGGRFG